MFMVYLNSYQFWYLKIVKPSYLGYNYSIINCSTIAMVHKNTSMCKLIKETKTPIMYLIGKSHFKWLIKYSTNTNVT